MRNKAQVYFGGQTIFKKFCPRIAAADNKNAGKLLSQGDTEGALKLYRKIYNYSNMVNALIGIEQCLSKQKKYDEAAKYLKIEITKFQKSQFYYYLELMLGDLLSESDKPNEAVIYYDSIFVQNPHIDYLNNINIRLAFLNEGIDSLKSYLSGKSKTKLSILLRLNEKEVKYFSVPIIIDLAGIEQLDLSRYFEKIKGKIILGDYSTSNSLMEISRYFLKKFDYDNAQFFAVKAVNQNLSSDENHCFVENLRMVNWFKNFGEETRKSFRYADGL
jgi:tetratricopeptide (TPR) repeat protein